MKMQSGRGQVAPTGDQRGERTLVVHVSEGDDVDPKVHWLIGELEEGQLEMLGTLAKQVDLEGRWGHSGRNSWCFGEWVTFL